MTESWAAATFDRLYEANEDPWDFNASPYEREKYETTLAALGQTRFLNGLEVGCSIGVFTTMLAPSCDRLLSVDASERALALASRRCRDVANVALARAAVPADWPEGMFDLQVFSEVLYFLNADDVRATAIKAAQCLGQNGRVLLVNWTGPTDTPCTGQAAAEIFIQASGLCALSCLRRTTYRLDVLGV